MCYMQSYVLLQVTALQVYGCMCMFQTIEVLVSAEN